MLAVFFDVLLCRNWENGNLRILVATVIAFLDALCFLFPRFPENFCRMLGLDIQEKPKISLLIATFR